MKRFSTLLVLVALSCLGCGGPLWEVTLYNATDAPITVSNGKSRTQEIAPGRGFTAWQVKPEMTLTASHGQKTVAQAKVGTPPLDFNPSADDRVLWVIGGPSSLALGDCQEFYVEEGATPRPNPVVKDVIDLRGKASVHLQRGDVLWWPNASTPDKVTVTQGTNPRLMRLVSIPADLPPDQLSEALKPGSK